MSFNYNSALYGEEFSTELSPSPHGTRQETARAAGTMESPSRTALSDDIECAKAGVFCSKGDEGYYEESNAMARNAWRNSNPVFPHSSASVRHSQTKSEGGRADGVGGTGNEARTVHRPGRNQFEKVLCVVCVSREAVRI